MMYVVVVDAYGIHVGGAISISKYTSQWPN